VVFLTGRTNPEDLVEGLRLGAHDYLRKPFDASELIARVSAAARVKHLQDELRRRNNELAVISRTDALTGLHNRRHIDERIQELMSGGRRHATTVGVLMLDIDFFKQVNDTAGHEAGDAVLREFAARICSTIRTEDIAGRWGGEEFVVLAPHTDLDCLCALGERLRKRVEVEPFDLGGNIGRDVTVSCGCAAGDARSLEDVLRRADRALYAAKGGGRNRVVGDVDPA
jgi:two-component system cell cycle response regulator